jgi:hypothetical protein
MGGVVMPKPATESEKTEARAKPTAVCTICNIEKNREDFRIDLKKINGLLSNCKECRGISSKERYKRNPEKKKEHRRKKYRENIDRENEYNREYRANNKEKRKEYAKRKYKENPQAVVEAFTKWKAENPERHKETQKKYKEEWRKNNPELYKQNALKNYHIRLARKKNVDVDDISVQDIIRRDGIKCYICEKVTNPDAAQHDPLKTELEHVIPLCRGGGHTWENLKISCFRCNRLKNYRNTPDQVREILGLPQRDIEPGKKHREQLTLEL